MLVPSIFYGEKKEVRRNVYRLARAFKRGEPIDEYLVPVKDLHSTPGNILLNRPVAVVGRGEQWRFYDFCFEHVTWKSRSKKLSSEEKLRAWHEQNRAFWSRWEEMLGYPWGPLLYFSEGNGSPELDFQYQDRKVVAAVARCVDEFDGLGQRCIRASEARYTFWQMISRFIAGIGVTRFELLGFMETKEAFLELAEKYTSDVELPPLKTYRDGKWQVQSEVER